MNFSRWIVHGQNPLKRAAARFSAVLDRSPTYANARTGGQHWGAPCKDDALDDGNAHSNRRRGFDVDQTFVSRLPIGSIEPKRSLGYSIGGSAAQRLQQFGISRSPGRALVETRAGPATADELAFDPPFLRVEARPFG